MIQQKCGVGTRIFIVTKNEELLYFDGYRNVIAKPYEKAINKTVTEVVEEKQKTNIGTRKNVRVMFQDGTNLLLVDARKDFPE